MRGNEGQSMVFERFRRKFFHRKTVSTAPQKSGIWLDGQLIGFEQAAKSLPAPVRYEIARHLLSPPPVRHAEPSVLLSMDDEPWRPSKRLLALAVDLVRHLPAATHPMLSVRSGGSPRWFDVFPGEHYHLLTTLARALKAQTVWEFGTDTGMGTLALLEGLEPPGRVYTVDVDPISQKPNPWLNSNDLDSGRVFQIVSDMKDPSIFARYSNELESADLIFVDGPKDGFTEAAFLERLARARFRNRPIVVFDDIRLMNMVSIWRAVSRPKLDLTSFGHWSGTGLIDWSGSVDLS
jgi:Methyltransferase domain